MKLPRLQELSGQTLGIVGFGEIGAEVAKRARAFDMEILYHKRKPLPATIEYGLGIRELGLMKPTASLVNTCRGPDVDEAALIAASRAGTIPAAPASTSSTRSCCSSTAR